MAASRTALIFKTMIRIVRNGTKFEYIPDHHILKFSGKYYEYKNGQVAGVRITYSDGTKRFISNEWFSEIQTKEQINNL